MGAGEGVDDDELEVAGFDPVAQGGGGVFVAEQIHGTAEHGAGDDLDVGIGLIGAEADGAGAFLHAECAQAQIPLHFYSKSMAEMVMFVLVL